MTNIAADACAFCGESPVVGTSTYDTGEAGPACALCCDAPSLREGETDLAFAERYADTLEARGHEWGSDAETALFVAIKEVRRLRQLDGEERAGETHERLYQAEAKLVRVEAYVETEGQWLTGSAADDGHHPLLDSTRADLRKLLRGEP